MTTDINIFQTTGLPAFDEMIHPIVSFATTAKLITAFLALFIGVGGYRFHRITSSIISFVVFSSLGSFLLYAAGLGRSALIIGPVIGIIATICAFFFPLFGICTTCCMIGYFIGFGLFRNVAIGITLALTLGVLGFASTKISYIIATSIGGGILTAVMICEFYGIATTKLPALLIGVGLVLCCFILQYADNRNNAVENPDGGIDSPSDGKTRQYKYFRK